MKPPIYAAIVLAAGLSSRLKVFKPLLKIGDRTLVDRAVNLFPPDSVDVYVVAGNCSQDLKAYLINRDLTFVENPDYPDGMFSSVKAGIKALKKDYQSFFILPVDVPLVRPYTVKRLMEYSLSQPEKIIYPVFKGKRGHPPLLPVALVPEILKSRDNGGLRAVLARFEESSLEVKVPDKYILFDIDTPEDYETAGRDFSDYDIPDPDECEIILDICKVDFARRLHSFKVAEIAGYIGQALLESGCQVNLELIKTGSVLHDILKSQSKHDIAAGNLLREMGFFRVADIVSVHTFFKDQVTNDSLDAAVVYLADKFVQGDRLVTLEERFSIANRPFPVTPEVAEIILKRKQRAGNIQRNLEKLIGKPLGPVIGLI